MTTYAPAKLSQRRSMTPEGFLLCRDVRMGRTGEMIYGPGQTPVPVGADGVARIERTADVVFHPDALASFMGKDITIKHPSTKVTPENWKSETVGNILSVRRGTGDESDFMVGDVLVKDPAAIKLANEGCEISCGYDAAYEETGPGRGRQTKIVGNHLAFLPDGIKGRCGPMCYVGDQSMDVEEPKTMTTKPTTGVSLLQRLFGAKDEASVQAILDAASREEQATRDADHAATIAALTKDVADLKAHIAKLTADEEEESDEDKKKREAKEKADADSTNDALDAAALAVLAPRVMAAAEIISPGLKVATHDAADLRATFDSLCACQRTALDNASKTATGKAVLDSINPGLTVDKMTVDQMSATFFAAAALMGAGNNAALAALASAGSAGAEIASNMSRSEMASKKSAERWAAQRDARNAIR